MPLPVSSPPVPTQPGTTPDVFLRAAQAMLQDKQVTAIRVAKLVGIANTEFHLVPDASQGGRAPVTELLRQIDSALQSVAECGGGTAARVLTVELNQLKQRARTTRSELELEVKRATTADDAARVQSLNAMLVGDCALAVPADPNTYHPDSLAGWLTDALPAGLQPAALSGFAHARFACTHITDSFAAPNVELERHRSAGFVDLQAAQHELDAAVGVLARYEGTRTRADIEAFDQELETIENTVRAAIRTCRRVLDDPLWARKEDWHRLARSWLGADLPAGADAARPTAPARPPVTLTPPKPALQATAQPTKPLVELLTPHMASARVPAGLIDELVANAQQRYQYHQATCTPANGEYEAMMRRAAGYVSLNAATLEVEAAWDATQKMEDPGGKASVLRSLIEIKDAISKAERYWQRALNEKACALIPGRRALAFSWLGEAPPAVRRNVSEVATPAPKVETPVKLLSWPVAASDHARNVLPVDPERDLSADRLARERELRAEPFRAFVNVMFEETLR